MGIIKRFKALLAGMAHTTAGKWENKNPQWLIADAEEKIRKSRKLAEEQLVEIQTWTEMIRLDMREAETALTGVREQKELAIRENDRELLAELLLREEDYQRCFEEKKRLFDSAVAEAIRIRDNYRQLESRMNEKMRMLKNIRSQSQLVAIRSRILELDKACGNQSELTERMDKLRFAVNEQSARIMAAEHLQRESLDAKVINLEQNLRWEKAIRQADALLEKGKST